MNLSSRVWVLAGLAVFALVLPNRSQASEEKPASLEAILEELSALRAIVESQQRQIEELRASAQPPSLPPTAEAVRPRNRMLKPGFPLRRNCDLTYRIAGEERWFSHS